jgi:hypothetical protein
MHVQMDVVPARMPICAAHYQPGVQVAYPEGEADVTNPMIRVTRLGHAWLLAEQQEQRSELGRYVSLAEIIDQLIKAAETETAP